MKRYQNRRQAGEVLADELGRYAGRSDVMVLGLPRGGVPVAYEIASRLGVPLDVFVVRKLGLPGQEELAMGAIASGGALALNEDLVADLSIDDPRPRASGRGEREYRAPHRLPPRGKFEIND